MLTYVCMYVPLYKINHTLYVCTYKFIMLLHFISLALDCFDAEDTQVDTISVVAAVVVLVVEILLVAVVVVTLKVGVSFDPFSIMSCKQSTMEINSAIQLVSF